MEEAQAQLFPFTAALTATRKRVGSRVEFRQGSLRRSSRSSVNWNADLIQVSSNCSRNRGWISRLSLQQ